MRRIDQEPGRESACLEVLVPAGKHIESVVREIIRASGFNPQYHQNGTLHATIEKSPVRLSFQHQGDIPHHVEEGRYDAGFVGSELFEEFRVTEEARGGVVLTQRALCFEGRFPPGLRLALLVKYPVKAIEELAGKRIVTRYPTLTGQYLAQHLPAGCKKPIIDSRAMGKEEVQVFDGKAAAAVVIVDTGTTMKELGLHELGDPVLEGIAPLLIYNPDSIACAKGGQRIWGQFTRQLQKSGNVTSCLPDFRYSVRRRSSLLPAATISPII